MWRHKIICGCKGINKIMTTPMPESTTVLHEKVKVLLVAVGINTVWKVKDGSPTNCF